MRFIIFSAAEWSQVRELRIFLLISFHDIRNRTQKTQERFAIDAEKHAVGHCLNCCLSTNIIHKSKFPKVVSWPVSIHYLSIFCLFINFLSTKHSRVYNVELIAFLTLMNYSFSCLKFLFLNHIANLFFLKIRKAGKHIDFS